MDIKKNSRFILFVASIFVTCIQLVGCSEILGITPANPMPKSDASAIFQVVPSKAPTMAPDNPSPTLSPTLTPKKVTPKATPTPKKVAPTVSPSSSQQSKATIVFTVNGGHYYHRDGCVFLDNSKIKTTPKDAIAKGYKPCSECKP